MFKPRCLFAFALLGLAFLLHFLGFLFLLPSKALSQAVLDSKDQKFQDLHDWKENMRGYSRVTLAAV